MSIKILNKATPTSVLISIWCLIVFVLAPGCSPTRKLLPNQYIVHKVEVEHYKQTGIPKEQFDAFFKQRPNRRMFGKIDFFIWWYNLFDDEKIKRKKAARNLKFDRKNAEKVKKYEKLNEERVAEGKKPKTPKLKNKESSMLVESIRDIGEAPILLDSQLTKQTRLQLSRFLFSKGYFNNKVTDTILVSKNKKRVNIKYNLYPNPPYTINHVSYKIDDKNLSPAILNDTVHSFIKGGQQYDLEKIQNERKRITDFLLNRGYYYFENAFISFDVDSNYNNRTVSVSVHIKQFVHIPSSSGDSLIYSNHIRYNIQNIYVITEQLVGNARSVKYNDTIPTIYPGTSFLINTPLKFKPFVILDNIDLHKGRYFNKDTAELTYKQLLGIGIFKNVLIQFFKSETVEDGLDCFIICSPVLKQSLTAETEGTTTNGNFGINGGIGYQNRNLIKGGELLEFKIMASVMAQKSRYSTDSNSTANPNNPKTGDIFNTFQFGPQLTYSLPRAYFPFSILPYKKDMLPRTYLKTSFNFLTTVDYKQNIINFTYGFSYRSNQKRLRHDIIPVEINAVKAVLTPLYEAELIKTNDAYLLYSYQDHLTILLKYVLTYKSKENSLTGNKVAYFWRWSIQSAGNVLRPLFSLTEQPQDSLGSYLIGGIPFAQFLKTDVDFRIYVPVRARSRLVYRLAGGIGVPQKNLTILPYEQSFFSGGPNSIRAWRARTLGPGGYNPSLSTLTFDKVGDILLEGNFEYRFHVINTFHGAFFVDAGNIWRLKPDDSKPDAQFQFNTFAQQIAIDCGIGIRWDMNYFVLRLDFAVPLKDPVTHDGDPFTDADNPKGWMFDDAPLNYGVFNFGIGYPF